MEEILHQLGLVVSPIIFSFFPSQVVGLGISEASTVRSNKYIIPLFIGNLGGGFKHVLFSPRFGDMILVDEHVSIGLKPPTSSSILLLLNTTISIGLIGHGCKI